VVHLVSFLGNKRKPENRGDQKKELAGWSQSREALNTEWFVTLDKQDL